MEQKELISETNVLFIIFGSMNYQLGVLDGEYKSQAKKWFSTLFKTATNLWRELEKNILKEETGKDAKEFYANKSAYLCDCARILVNLPPSKEEEVFKYLKEQLK